MPILRHDLGLVPTHFDVLERFLNVQNLFVVDAGCGDMSFSKALAERGARVLGIDPDPQQAKLNQQAQVHANVGFAQCGADAIPVEPGMVDGVVFSYSFHHIPAEQYQDVLSEWQRILKPDGFVYVIEPVAAGDLNEIMRLFHDEQAVRAKAEDVLNTSAAPMFENVNVIDYRIPLRYGSWEEYASKYAGKTYNANYTEAQVRDEAVRERFEQLGGPTGYYFESPMRVTCLQSLKSIANA